MGALSAAAEQGVTDALRSLELRHDCGSLATEGSSFCSQDGLSPQGRGVYVWLNDVIPWKDTAWWLKQRERPKVAARRHDYAWRGVRRKWDHVLRYHHGADWAINATDSKLWNAAEPEFVRRAYLMIGKEQPRAKFHKPKAEPTAEEATGGL